MFVSICKGWLTNSREIRDSTRCLRPQRLVHLNDTGIRKHASSSQFGTRAYEPPEAVTRLLAPRSRLYDIWSFGCVMLEFVVWLLYGHRGLDEFWHLPVQSDGTLFWSKLPGDLGPGAEVNRTVTQIIDTILATNAACRSPSAIGDLLLLIKNRVLDLPLIPQCTCR